MAEILRLSEVSRKLGRMPALTDVSVSVYGGRVVGLCGLHGCGKSTLLRIAAGLMRTDFGEVEICGLPVGKKTRALTACLPDRDMLPDDVKIGEAVRLFSGWFKDFSSAAALAMLDDLSIDINKRFGTFSQGARRGIQFALTASRQTALYLLDEPAAGADERTRAYIYQKIGKLAHDESAVLVAVNDIAEAALALDDLLILQNGTVRHYGSARECDPAALFKEVCQC